jgi:YabP family.
MDENIAAGEHTLNYQKNRLTLTGVKEVKSFEDKEVVLNLADVGMLVKGTGLTVAELNLKTGLLRIDGTLDSVAYTRSHEKLGVIKRLFK